MNSGESQKMEANEWQKQFTNVLGQSKFPLKTLPSFLALFWTTPGNFDS